MARKISQGSLNAPAQCQPIQDQATHVAVPSPGGRLRGSSEPAAALGPLLLSLDTPRVKHDWPCCLCEQARPRVGWLGARSECTMPSNQGPRSSPQSKHRARHAGVAARGFWLAAGERAFFTRRRRGGGSS